MNDSPIKKYRCFKLVRWAQKEETGKLISTWASATLAPSSGLMTEYNHELGRIYNNRDMSSFLHDQWKAVKKLAENEDVFGAEYNGN